jgi:hypothetical protein
MFREGIKLRFPESAVLFDPGGGVFHGLGREPAARAGADV